MSIRHLPYHLDEKASRFAFYETFWKRRGLDLLLRYCSPQGKTLLDYGCGRGECLGMAAEAGFAVRGTDMDPECVALASHYGPTCQLDLRDPLAQFGAKSFDVVTCFHVLEHVDNPKEVLTNLGKMARTHVVIAVPNLRSLHRLFVRQIDLENFNEGHLQSWDHWHLLNLAEKHCGLKLISWGFDATILPLASDLSEKIFGQKAAIRLETDIFRRMFPYHGISVLGLFQPVDSKKEHVVD
jgi:SAM-dependent methyltransferase